MIVHVDVSSVSVRLVEQDNHSRLILTVEGSSEVGHLRTLMCLAGAGDSDGHEAAVSLNWLRSQCTEPDGSTQELVDVASTRGRIDEDGKYIVAPVLWAADDPSAVPRPLDWLTVDSKAYAPLISRVQREG